MTDNQSTYAELTATSVVLHKSLYATRNRIDRLKKVSALADAHATSIRNIYGEEELQARGGYDGYVIDPSLLTGHDEEFRGLTVGDLKNYLARLYVEVKGLRSEIQATNILRREANLREFPHDAPAPSSAPNQQVVYIEAEPIVKEIYIQPEQIRSDETVIGPGWKKKIKRVLISLSNRL